MQWDLIFFVVLATIWGVGVVFGLVLPDKTSKRILNWVAEVEHQPFWWLPVGLLSLVLFGYGLSRAIDIKVDWIVLGRSLVLLVGVFVPLAIWIILGLRNNSSEKRTELEEEEVQDEEE
ncbi:MAG: hypothetical protein KatS3mg088_004 [Patescibacteria group bacterium]|nr:MAG: hypothetical protein KatS3mg088_004 [Patescibacteria group bacterium]